MVRKLQPCDWQERDVYNKDGSSFYAIDSYGRSPEKEIIRIRIVGFKPYFYVRFENIDESCEFPGGKMTKVEKYDIWGGFNGFKPIDVIKVEFPTIALYRNGIKIAKESNVTLYESNIPPFLRFFHERNIQPASPILFQPMKDDPKFESEDVKCHKGFIVNYQDVNSDPTGASIPLLLAAYDLEVYSDSGKFPVAFNEKDKIIQIGVTFRWTNDLMKIYKRRCLVLGTIPDHPEMESCHSEKDLIQEFANMIEKENPDIIVGYNTFGFDDKYLIDRAKLHRMNVQFGRVRIPFKAPEHGKPDFRMEHKVFELASGKYDVNYIRMPGRLTIDLLLNMRREHNLDSYKLDSVANTFLRDKVINYDNGLISTKSTRGLCVGNYVRFDLVGNTTDPYADGTKFTVVSVDDKTFRITAPLDLFNDLTDLQRKSLEWTFTKDDVSAKDIFRMQLGTPEDRATIARYCLQDCDLVTTLMAKLDTLVNARGMADVCIVPMQYLFLRGQGIKIYSRIAFEALQRNQIILTQEAAEGDIEYEGAIVISPKIDMYLDQPIAVLDYNSLYPSSMIAENLSPDSFVCEKRYNENGKLRKHVGLTNEQMREFEKEGFRFNKIEYESESGEGDLSEKLIVHTYFVDSTNNHPLSMGIIPQSLQIMLQKRKEVRQKAEFRTVTTKSASTFSGLVSEKDGIVTIKGVATVKKEDVLKIEDTYDDAQKSVFNGLQSAYKVVANSIYGQCGSKVSPIRKLAVAACTTAVGRRQLLFAKDVVEKEFGGEVIYGDSVASYTPVMVRVHGQIQIVKIEDLHAYGKGWMVDGDKELCVLDGVSSWTEHGWTSVHQIIRHKLAERKKMIRILTRIGLVDVTDDHSLIKNTGESISPKDVQVGTKLLHHRYPNADEKNFNFTEEEARIAGFFFREGSCGNYECPSGNKSSWALNSSNIEMLEYYKKLCEKVYPQLSWVILPTLLSSNVYTLIPNRRGVDGKLKEFIVAYRSSMYSDNAKRMPIGVLNGSLEVRQAFWDGLCDGDVEKDIVRIDLQNQLSAAHVGFLASTLGYATSINTLWDEPDVYRITCTISLERDDPHAIKKIEEVAYNGYVYDLTTDNHHFQAGVGRMIVHNTDSIFIKFDGTKNDVALSIKKGQLAAEAISARCKAPLVIGYEKTMYPFILFCRKRYVGMLYEDDPTIIPKRKSMGIVLKRRDNAPIVKDVFGGALDMLLSGTSIADAALFVQEMLKKVLNNQLPIEKYIITKQLRDDYKDPTRIAHRVLADRMISRDPGSAPSVGDRLQFVYIKKDNPRREKMLQGDKIENLEYIKENKLVPDAIHYIENQIQNPVAQLFALGIDRLSNYKEPRPTYEKIYADAMVKYEDDHEKATLHVLARKEKHLESLLFLESPVMQRIINPDKKIYAQTEMTSFFKKK